MGQVDIPDPPMQTSPINRRTKLARSELELVERLARPGRLVYSPHKLAELFRAMREHKLYSQHVNRRANWTLTGAATCCFRILDARNPRSILDACSQSIAHTFLNLVPGVEEFSFVLIRINHVLED